MRDLGWRLGFTLTALALLVFLGPSTCSRPRQHLVEWVLGQTPQARIADYLAAVAEGDREAALDLWSPIGSSEPALLARRESVTGELLAYGPRLEHRIVDVVWWRTCCEPDVIQDPAEAGGAHLRVAVRSEAHPETVFVFDLLVPGGYWGAAMGHPVRHWALVDVYPEGAAPLVWPWQE